MNLPLPIIITFVVMVICCIVLMVGFGPIAGILGLMIVALAFYIGAATEGEYHKN